MQIPVSRQILLLSLALFAASARADSPGITAVLTDSAVEVGQMVQLQIKVTGTTRARPPDQIEVNGLEIRYTGQSTEVMMRNFTTSYTAVYNYTILPERSGRFTIPPLTVDVGGSKLRTPELTLAVSDGAQGNAARGNRGSAGSAPVGNDQIGFAEIVVPKKSAFVGEMIPIVVRVGLSARLRHQLLDPQPEISAQGFTIEKMHDPQQSMETVNGRSYEVFTYKTALSATRAGKLEIGPAQQRAVVIVPRRGSGSRSPFDLFGPYDPFSDPIFRDPFGAMGEQRELPIKSEPVALEVKPLPPSAPPSFAGAVGIFNLSADASPKKVQVGDPITVTAAVSGRGNFDRVSAPTLSDENGWHKYPASGNFRQDDEVGISGTKTFETVVSPNEPKRALPPLLFSFFDPLKEKYVTLQSDPVALAVTGAALPSAQAPGSVPPAGVASPSPATGQDLLPQITEPGHLVHSLVPLPLRKEFWLAQLLPLAGVIALAGARWWRRRRSNLVVMRTAQWQREAEALLRKMRRTELTPQSYFSDAARVVRLKTALKQNVPPETVDSEAAAAAFDLDEAGHARLRRLFSTSDELRYSGGANGGQTITGEEKRETLETLESLRA